MPRSYLELSQLETYEERMRYLALGGRVGEITFGHERVLNQNFYHSRQWRLVRNKVIVRDQGCDLGIEGYEIYSGIHIHHMNPIRVDDLENNYGAILDPEFLISTTQATHNAIHYGDERHLPRSFTERRPGDTKLWGRKDTP